MYPSILEEVPAQSGDILCSLFGGDKLVTVYCSEEINLSTQCIGKDYKIGYKAKESEHQISSTTVLLRPRGCFRSATSAWSSQIASAPWECRYWEMLGFNLYLVREWLPPGWLQTLLHFEPISSIFKGSETEKPIKHYAQSPQSAEKIVRLHILKMYAH